MPNELVGIVLANPAIRSIWDNWGRLHLPDCWLVAGCVAQTVWNHRFGLPAQNGISDIDLVYFDPDDLSAASEQDHASRLHRQFPGLGAWLDVKNEARVHLWYEAKFGFAIPPYRSVADAIDTFPTTATTIGLRPGPGRAEVYATFGLEDLLAGVVRPNKRLITRDIYEAKVARWVGLWPRLKVVAWDAALDPAAAGGQAVRLLPWRQG